LFPSRPASVFSLQKTERQNNLPRQTIQERSTMKVLLSLALAVCGVASAQLTPVPPSPTGTPSHPFFITKTWIVGGVGDWDYLTMDPAARQLFIAHGPSVQVVDVETGAVAGVVRGMRETHSVVLDTQGSYGYISDGPADLVRVFDRRTFQIVANIPTGPSPRSMVLDPTSGLLFVVGSQTTPASGQTRSPQATASSRRTAPAGGDSSRTSPLGGPISTVTVIDSERRVPLAQIALSGSLGFAQGDGNGRIYITISDRNQILKLDAQAIGSAVHRIIDNTQAKPATSQASQANKQLASNARPAASQTGTVEATEKGLFLDWTPGAKSAPPADALPHALSLDSNCQRPRALAVDTAHERLFAACTNMRMVALDADSGQTVAALPIGIGADAIGYDADRGLIFTADGGNSGSLTIIRQDVTDTYSVIQTLPTRQNARTLAINPSNGEVYLASVIYGAVLNNPPINGAPLKMSAIDSSFQVLVVGN
jgi:DNA-binding beta-propeller fold protein YncE